MLGLVILRPLRVRDFRLLWIGQTLSLVGDQFGFIALPFLVFQVTGSAATVAAVWVINGAIRAAMLLIGGATADRIPGRWVVMTANLGAGLLAVAIGALALTHQARIWQLVAFAVATALADAFFLPAYQRLIPTILEPELLTQGNALNVSSRRLAQLLAAGAAGGVVALGGVGPAFLFDGLSFLVAAGLVSAITANNVAGAPARPGLLRDIGAGLTHVAGDRPLLAMLPANTIAALGAGFGIVGMILLAHGRFPEGPAAFGAMIAAWGAGNLIGTVFAGSRARLGRRGAMVILGFASVGVLQLAQGLAPTIWVAVLLIFISGVLWSSVEVIVPTFLQSRPDPALRGRVLSIGQLGEAIANPAGIAVAGLLSGSGPVVVMAAGGAAFLVGAAVAAASRALRRLD